MTAPHQHRQGGTTTKRRKAHGPAKEYAPGFFTELARQHNFPPGHWWRKAMEAKA